uniref:DNA-directed DNA polymerase n=3 Tax=Parvoviridae TaxID=10780 RepID=A0A8A4XCC9_9VIRU|nr:MAG: PolB [Tarsiger cyanurus densovirus]
MKHFAPNPLPTTDVYYGYFRAERYEDIIEYIKKLLEKYKESIVLRFHVSYDFVKQKTGETIQVHQKKEKIQIKTFDPDFTNIDEHITNLVQLASNPDNYQYEGSGLSLIPDSITYWVKLYPCQPQPTPAPSTSSVTTEKVYKENDCGYMQCMRRHFKFTNTSSVIRLSKSVHINEVKDTHERYFPFINITVFTRYGNTFYHHLVDDGPVCYCYMNSNHQLSYIYDLQKFFKSHTREEWCNKCLKWKRHTTECSCEKTITIQTDNSLNIKEKPAEKYKYVCYADFEAFTSQEGIHTLSGFAYIVVDALGNEKHSYMRSGPQNHAEDFIEELYNFTEQFMNEKDVLPVLFHNFKGYDSHFLLQALMDCTNITHIQGKSLEKLNTIHVELPNKRKLHFKDSFNFLSASLARLAKTIQNRKFSEDDNKGVFPYDWFDDINKLNDRQLPPAPWFNKLTQKEQDVALAEQDWIKYECQNFKDYHDAYMYQDVMLLADVFEQFRDNVIKEFNVDPLRFQGAPSLTWYLAAHKQKDNFYIINDADIYMDIQNSIRGGVAQAMVRYAEADPAEETIVFLDVNALYSKCMSYPLPTKYIQTLTSLPNFWENEYTMSSPTCLLINCDLSYPQHLHDRDWAYPLCPHKFNDRLCTTFEDKKNILLHHENLKFYLEHGLKLEKIHYAYEFLQTPLLKDYVEANIHKRTLTQDSSEKDMYKLMNNSLYGKTCENVFKYRSFGVVKQKQYKNGKVTPEIGDHNVIDVMFMGEKALIEKGNSAFTLKKPVQAGYAILEFAKLEIYKFLYTLQNIYGDLVTPMYTDTDSLMLFCKFPNAYEEFYGNARIRPFLDFENNKISGLWAPEHDIDNPIVKYVGLRAKTYAYQSNRTVMKNKGVPMHAMKKGTEINIEDYEKVLRTNESLNSEFYKITSKNHEVKTEEIKRMSLAAHDDKRIVLQELHISIPFGYKGDKFKY